MIVPTLQDFSATELQSAKVAQIAEWEHGNIPFITMINQLRVISELTANAAEFLHYLRWRRALPLEDVVLAVDEMDLFSAYLHRGQLPRQVRTARARSRIMVVGTSTPIDDYYYFEAGMGHRFRKPEMTHSSLTRRFVRRMTQDRPRDWLEAAGTCLELSKIELEGLDGQASRIAKQVSDTDILIARIELDASVTTRPEERPSLAILGIGRKTSPADVWARVRRSIGDVERVVFLSTNAKGAPTIKWALTNREEAGA